MVKIFDIENGKIVINENCLLIPELKVILENYEDPIPVLGYVHFTTSPHSPYWNLPPDIKEETVLADYEGDYTADDEPVYKAVEKMTKLYESDNMRLLKNAKIGLNTLGTYLGKAMIRDDEKSGNFATFQNALKSIAKISKEFSDLERQVQEELRIRGQGKTGYDEI